MIVARSPFRVSLLGGGSDFPEHYILNTGAVVGGSINRFCFVSVRQRPRSFGSLFRVRYSQVDEGSSPSDIRHPAVRALLERFEVSEALDLNHSSDLPSRSGVGSSSAFLATLVAGLAPSTIETLSRYELVQLISSVERDVLGERTGLQDAIFTTFGGFGLVEFSSDGFRVQHTRASRAYLSHLAGSCFLIYLGNERLSTDQQAELLAGMPKTGGILSEMADLARSCFTQIDSESLSPEELGALVATGWDLKKASSPKASNLRVDEVFDYLKRRGAWGGKLLGAGGGGFFLSIAPAGARAALEHDFPKLITCDFDWDYSGLTVQKVL